MTQITGGCLCGAVRYEIAVDPMMMGDCYCSDCRKASGTGHGSNIAFPEAGVSITGDLSHYDVTADSGATVSRHFCPTCGVKVCSASTGFSGMTMISAGTLDDVEFYQPRFAVYASRAPSWDRPASDVHAFPEMPPRG